MIHTGIAPFLYNTPFNLKLFANEKHSDPFECFLPFKIKFNIKFAFA